VDAVLNVLSGRLLSASSTEAVTPGSAIAILRLERKSPFLADEYNWRDFVQQAEKTLRGRLEN
jgi:hypothetical protein